MDPDRPLTLTDAAVLAGCSRKALERRVERGSLATQRDAHGQRVVRVTDLMRAGLVAPAPAGAEQGPVPERLAEAERELAAMRTALAVTEAALHRVRDDMREMRLALVEVEARAQQAEQDLTRALLDGSAVGQSRRGRLRLRSA